MTRLLILLLLVCLCGLQPDAYASEDQPYVIVLGIAQDGGVPQAGTKEHEGWDDGAFAHRVVCLAVVDPKTSQRWMIDCTPDFRSQLHSLDEVAPAEGKPGLSGIFLTHAHIGHYTGLIHLGHEVMGASGVRVYAMPKMRTFLSKNGPWDQLVRYENIELETLNAGSAVRLNDRLRIEPFLVPHRQEYSEVVGYRITGPNRSVLFIPDIDSWEEWAERGSLIEEIIPTVDVAYLDATFFSDTELPGRDMSGFPHPFISHSMERLAHLSPQERARVRFIHLNHTNPALIADGDARRTIRERGFRVAQDMERVDL